MITYTSRNLGKIPPQFLDPKGKPGWLMNAHQQTQTQLPFPSWLKHPVFVKKNMKKLHHLDPHRNRIDPNLHHLLVFLFHLKVNIRTIYLKPAPNSPHVFQKKNGKSPRLFWHDFFHDIFVPTSCGGCELRSLRSFEAWIALKAKRLRDVFTYPAPWNEQQQEYQDWNTFLECIALSVAK